MTCDKMNDERNATQLYWRENIGHPWIIFSIDKTNVMTVDKHYIANNQICLRSGKKILGIGQDFAVFYN